jgi:hypothetical protein
MIGMQPPRPQLVIEYVLDGKRPGYAFRPPTNGFDEALLKTVWRHAMPRGQGWGDLAYTGARSLKCFPIDKHTVAVSEVVVTGQQDEGGRRGIRRAEIHIFPAGEYLPYLKRRLESFPETLRLTAYRKLDLACWAQVVDGALPKVKGRAPQVIVTHPYAHPEAWQVVEILVLRLATSWRLRALKGWGRVNSLTTLALNHREESRIIALPLDRAAQVRDVPVIDLS